jgi:hypothetical protein
MFRIVRLLLEREREKERERERERERDPLNSSPTAFCNHQSTGDSFGSWRHGSSTKIAVAEEEAAGETTDIDTDTDEDEEDKDEDKDKDRDKDKDKLPVQLVCGLLQLTTGGMGNVPLDRCSIVSSARNARTALGDSFYTDGEWLVVTFTKVPCIIEYITSAAKPCNSHDWLELLDNAAIELERTTRYETEFSQTMSRCNEIMGAWRIANRWRAVGLNDFSLKFNSVDWTKEVHEIEREFKDRAPKLHSFLSPTNYKIGHIVRTTQRALLLLDKVRC